MKRLVFGGIYLIGALFIFLNSATAVIASTPFQDNFDSYTAGADVVGQGDWTGYQNGFQVVNGDVCDSGNCIQTKSVEKFITRTEGAPMMSGSWDFRLRVDVAPYYYGGYIAIGYNSSYSSSGDVATIYPGSQLNTYSLRDNRGNMLWDNIPIGSYHTVSITWDFLNGDCHFYVNLDHSANPAEALFYGSEASVCWDVIALGNPFSTKGGVNSIYFYSGSPYYTPWEVDNISESAVGCTSNCNSNVLFIPGIEGSRLYNAAGKLWEPTNDGNIESLFLNPDGTSQRDDIYTKDLIETFSLKNTGIGPDIYKSFLQNLDTWKTTSIIADYGLAPYDWRLSLNDILDYGNQTSDGSIYYSGSQRATSTPYILEQLRTLAATSRTGKVTIVAHSNGGLVAKALMKRLQDTNDPLLKKIDNLVLVAVPQTGTPKAIGAALHGFDLAIPFTTSPAISRELSKNSPTTYNLLPSEEYFSGVGAQISTPPVAFKDDGSTIMRPFITAYGSKIDNVTKLDNFLMGSEGRAQPAQSDLDNPAVLSSSLLAYGNDQHLSLDAWVPPTSTMVYQVAGWGEETVGSIQYETEKKCTLGFFPLCLKETPELTYTPQIIIDGDGTVVTPSALAISTSTSNVTRWWLDLNSFNGPLPDILRTKHHNIFEVSQLRSFIESIITHNSLSNLPYISTSQPPTNNTKRLRFVLHSPMNLSAQDVYGKEVSATTSTLPGGKFERFGEVQYISVPVSSAPTLVLDGYAAGSFTLEIQEVSGDDVVASTTFSGIPNATTTKATMSFPDGTVAHASLLLIDTDGNGTVDSSLTPVVNGTVIPDLEPPEAIIMFNSINKTINLTRTDNISPTSTPVAIPTSAVSSILTDDAGHTIKLAYSKNEQRLDHTFLTISTLTYDGVATSNTAFLRYYWSPSSSVTPAIFISYLKTQDTSLIALYLAVSKRTTIFSATPQDGTMDPATLVAQLRLHPRLSVKQYNRLIVPFISTVHGKIQVNY
jgi:pimeloyl-ACP methyl ester carboxylesterase